MYAVERLFLILGGIGIALLVFFATAPGQFAIDILQLIPGGVWGWLFGFAALATAVYLFRQL